MGEESEPRSRESGAGRHLQTGPLVPQVSSVSAELHVRVLLPAISHAVASRLVPYFMVSALKGISASATGQPVFRILLPYIVHRPARGLPPSSRAGLSICCKLGHLQMLEIYLSQVEWLGVSRARSEQIQSLQPAFPCDFHLYSLRVSLLWTLVPCIGLHRRNLITSHRQHLNPITSVSTFSTHMQAGEIKTFSP